MSSEDQPEAAWRRPPDGVAAQLPQPQAPPRLEYPGPPPTVPPPLHHIPAPLIQPLPPPRALPPQDHAAIDQEERLAWNVSLGVGVVAGVLGVLVLLFIIVRGLSG